MSLPSMEFLSPAVVHGAVLETRFAVPIRKGCTCTVDRRVDTRNSEGKNSLAFFLCGNAPQFLTGSWRQFMKRNVLMGARFFFDVQRSPMSVQSRAELSEPDRAVRETVRSDNPVTEKFPRTSIVAGGVRKSSNGLYPSDGEVDWSSFDVVVIGVGAAGLYSALSLPSHLRVAVVTKEGVDSTCSSTWAQGGIAAVTDVDPIDSIELHEDDTIAAGDGLCDPDAVRFLVSKGRECIDSLLRLGTNFDKLGDDLALTLEAAHSRARILHVGDATGREIVRSLKEQVLSRPNIRVIDQAVVLDVALDEHKKYCHGVKLFHEGKLVFAPARAVIVAAGGGGQVYYPTSNPAAITGDSAAIGWRAGALLRDLEFVQFHPTTFRREGAPTTLVTEAVRGEGAHIIDEQGRRFMFDYHAAGELAPRSTVSRSIFLHLQHTGASCVFLDLRHLARDKVQNRFPNLIHFCATWGLDVHSHPIPVAPAAHYWMGGLFTDLSAQTTLRGLYAVGEAASTGVHGANRLASNSLLECLVFASQLCKLQLNPHHQTPRPRTPPNQTQTLNATIQHAVRNWRQQREVVQGLREEVPRLMGEFAGICRDGSRMETALQQVQHWRTQLCSLPISALLASLLADGTVSEAAVPLSVEDIRTWSDTRNLLDVALLILQSAVFRTESRGAHYRADYPHSDRTWEAHTLVHKDSIWRSKIGDGQVVTRANAAPVSS